MNESKVEKDNYREKGCLRVRWESNKDIWDAINIPTRMFLAQHTGGLSDQRLFRYRCSAFNSRSVNSLAMGQGISSGFRALPSGVTPVRRVCINCSSVHLPGFQVVEMSATTGKPGATGSPPFMFSR